MPSETAKTYACNHQPHQQRINRYGHQTHVTYQTPSSCCWRNKLSKSWYSNLRQLCTKRPVQVPQISARWEIAGLVNIQKTSENGRRNRWFSPMNNVDLSIVYVNVYQRVASSWFPQKKNTCCNEPGAIAGRNMDFGIKTWSNTLAPASTPGFMGKDHK